MDAGPIILSFKLAFVVTILLMVIGIPIAFWLARSKSRWKPIVEALVSMPLVLPPTVIGFYLLVAFSPTSSLGSFLIDALGMKLVFTFPGLVIASIIYSLPFMVHPIQSGLSSLPTSLVESAYVLGKSRWSTLTRVLLPNIKNALISGIVLSFAHTIGEFGVVLMIGGNIPDETRVASIAIFDEVEALNYGEAHQYSAILFVICFLILLTVYYTNRESLKVIQ